MTLHGSYCLSHCLTALPHVDILAVKLQRLCTLKSVLLRWGEFGKNNVDTSELPLHMTNSSELHITHNEMVTILIEFKHLNQTSVQFKFNFKCDTGHFPMRAYKGRP